MLNIGSGKEVTIRTLALLIKKVTGFKGTLIFNKNKLVGKKRNYLNISKLKKQELIDNIENATSMFDVFWNSEILNIDLKTPEKRAAFRLQMEKKISLIDDSVVRKEYRNSFYSYYNNLFHKNYSHYKKTNYKNENSELDKLNADRVNNNSFSSLREKNLLEAIFNNPTLLKKVEEDFALLVFSNKSIETLRLALLDLYKENGNLTDLDITELKNDLRYSPLIKEIFKAKNWASSKFIPEYVKPNEDLDYIEKCWKEALNLQKKWYKKKNI